MVKKLPSNKLSEKCAGNSMVKDLPTGRKKSKIGMYRCRNKWHYRI